MDQFEEKINEIIGATYSVTLEEYYSGYRAALHEALNVYKETRGPTHHVDNSEIF